MGKDSGIQWTHHTFNPWWGCQRVSPGCENCYAEAFDHRLGRADWGPRAPRRFFGASHWAQPLKWDQAAQRAGEQHRVFCASMADVFEDRDDLVAPRARLFETILCTPHLDWLLLTKRPENIERMLPQPSWSGHGPWPNVWLGTTVEDQRRADERIPALMRVPAVVRFLSCEPLLESVTLGGWLKKTPDGHLSQCRYCGYSVDMCVGEGGNTCPICSQAGSFVGAVREPIDWVICGGESGSSARPFSLFWAGLLQKECAAAGTAFFMKQVGQNPLGFDPTTVASKRLVLKDRHGGDPLEWPAWLRRREFPKARVAA